VNATNLVVAAVIPVGRFNDITEADDNPERPESAGKQMNAALKSGGRKAEKLLSFGYLRSRR
jgi:hypothetical protein